MLSVDKPFYPAMNSSRIYRGVPKPAVDFLARNKRATKKKAPRDQSQNNARSEPKKHTTKQVASESKAKAHVQDANTVVIDKSYLEGLLRMSMAPSNTGVVRKDVTHVQLESNQVPGLESHTVTAPQAAHPHTVTAPQAIHPHAVPHVQATHPHNVTAPQPHIITAPQHPHTVMAPQSSAPLTAKEQWLKDLAEQVKEKKQQKKKQNRDTTEEVYFPFGRPGCGAPIRTESGKVVADLRSKVRSSFEGPVQQVPMKPERGVSPPDNEYFPYGRPGCGAPNNTASHGISYQPYGADVPSQQAGPHHIQTGSYPAGMQPTTAQFQPPPSYQPTVTSYQPPPANQPPPHTLHPHAGQYLPFGQQGAGAPITTHTTHTHLPPPPHPPTQGLPQTMNVNPPQAQDSSMVSPREGYGRGAGPYVDKFVRQDMDQRRKRELDYRADLANQIAAQKREKETKRLAKEREEALEEAKLAQERERLNRQYQREVIERRRKEELAMQRHKMLQEGLEQAKQSALIAKMKAKGGIHPTPSMHTPSHTTHTVHNPHDQNTLSLSSKFDSVLRSPSLLQLQEIPRNTEKKTSRIPVRRFNNSKTHSTPHRAPPQRGTSNRVTLPTVRPASPPIPTLAKKLNRPPAGYTTASGTTVTLPSNIVRSISPPVPTLAKKMSKPVLPALPSLDERAEPGRSVVRAQSPPVPTLTKKMSHDNTRISRDLPATHRQGVRPHSPPVSTKPNVSKLNQNISSVRPPSPDGVTIPINRQPSCELVRDDYSPTLPAIAPTTQNHGEGQRSEGGGPSRQQVILEQLAALKKGILSHQSTIDQRVNLIMARRRPNF